MGSAFNGFNITVLVVKLYVFCLLLGFAHSSSYCTYDISPQEVSVLRQVAKEVGKHDWNCSTDPCNTSQNATCWKSEEDPVWQFTNFINCTCYNDTWHVSDIYWKGLNLTGVLPKSLAKLPYIKKIDFAGNSLTGTFPPEWANTKLEFLSVFINRLSGPIPKYLGNITTLKQLSLESNQFSGTVPPELGNLVNLILLALSDNNLTGQLPVALKNLVNLQYLFLTSNKFSGRLPDFFDHYTELLYLELVGTGFEGPIPPSISTLQNLRVLKISDLNGEGSAFPPLQNLTFLNSLMLRSCNITGPIPSYIGDTLKLRTILDLSFNKLTGSIPNMPVVENLYLTSNMLNGPIPDWIATSDRSHIDISYNNFDEINALVEEHLCSSNTINLYRCDARQKTLDSSACLERSKCSKDRYSLHINCGGHELRIGKITYEQDTEIHGASTFFHGKENWGFSSSGEYMIDQDNYIAQNTSLLRMNDNLEVGLYKEARVSASSLTYYGRCLAKGYYTVTLHFSEIVFSDDNTYIGHRRRIFDIYIQEKLYAKDFDIMKEANGTNKAIKKIYKNIYVKNSIEIRLYFSGKGSIRVRVNGNSGPLISAISIESQFDPPFDWKIVIWVLLGVALCLFIFALGKFWWKLRKAYIKSREQEFRAKNPQIGLFTYKQIKNACNNFNAANKLGQGGFGSVYKGTLVDGTHIAVKQLSPKSSQGNREFVNEIGVVSSLHHPNLVRLYGCCVDTSQLVLVYEYMENKDLGHVLFGSNDGRLKLDWPTRKMICIGIARGLAFLHEESTIKIVHRDIKATNILLDWDLNPKIADFGLAKLNEEENTHISTRIAGTVGYMAPEYALRGYLTPKADVYSFGVVLLEVMSGRSNSHFQPQDDYFCLLDWASVVKQKGDLMELMDPKLGTNYNKEEALKIIQVSLLCTNPSPTLRPTMLEALNMLEGNSEVPDPIMDPNNLYTHDWMYRSSKDRKHTFEAIEETRSMSSFESSLSPYQVDTSTTSSSSYQVFNSA